MDTIKQNNIDNSNLNNSCSICYENLAQISLCEKCKLKYCNDCANKINNRCCICFRSKNNNSNTNNAIINIYDNDYFWIYTWNNYDDDFDNRTDPIIILFYNLNTCIFNSLSIVLDFIVTILSYIILIIMFLILFFYLILISSSFYRIIYNLFN